MIVLDENIRTKQAELLRGFGVSSRKIGVDLAAKGTSDADIIPLLHRLNQPTLFTLDTDFWKANLRHDGYCIAYLDVEPQEAAEYIRRFLRQASFNTSAKRLGKVVHIHADGISYFAAGGRKVHSVAW